MKYFFYFLALLMACIGFEMVWLFFHNYQFEPILLVYAVFCFIGAVGMYWRAKAIQKWGPKQGLKW